MASNSKEILASNLQKLMDRESITQKDIAVASVTVDDTPVCSMFNIDTQESYDDSSECYSESIDFINFMNGVLEDTMDTYNLSYDKLEKWAPWALENNS